MPVAELAAPRRLLAGGGPSTPDDRVLRALTTPLIGQFDPCFTSIMDEVMQLARRALRTRNARCFAISALASAGPEALINTLVQEGDQVDVLGSTHLADTVRRYGGVVVSPAPVTIAVCAGEADLAELAADCHARGGVLVVDATATLGGLEFQADTWGIDAVVAGVDGCLGAVSGMTLVSYGEAVERRMRARASPPRTSYLDLLQLQAYWSPERLNHHTAPTSLVYALREALRLLDDEGLAAVEARHARVSAALGAGLRALGLEARRQSLVWTVAVADAAGLQRRLLEEYGVWVRRGAAETLTVGLVGADARLENALRVLAAFEQLYEGRGGAREAALQAFAAA